MADVKYGKFEMPESIKCEEIDASGKVAKFIAEPFVPGYAHTIGNALRRILLSSMEAPAIISVRIEGVPHEYMAMEGVIEDMTYIVLNLKGALLRKLPSREESGSRESKIISTILEVSQEDLDQSGGQKEICLKDVIKSTDYEVVNPDHRLFTVTAPFKRQISFRVAFGRGYVPSERHQIADKLVDEILIDSIFTPVRLVNYFVENTRVGQDTDFDRLVMEVHTDGRITPTEAVSFATQIGISHLEVFHNISKHKLIFEEESKSRDNEDDALMGKLALRIDEIELSVRSTNCLSGAKIEYIGELVIIPEKHMLNFRNFGKKSLQEIKDKLEEMGLHLGMELSSMGLTRENVRDKIKDYLEKHKNNLQAAAEPRE